MTNLELAAIAETKRRVTASGIKLSTIKRSLILKVSRRLLASDWRPALWFWEVP
jgi:hypothetical protein